MMEHWEWPQYVFAFLYAVLIMANTRHSAARGLLSVIVVAAFSYTLHKGGFW